MGQYSPLVRAMRLEFGRVVESGLLRNPAKVVAPKGVRGFKSLSFRQITKEDNVMPKIKYKEGDQEIECDVIYKSETVEDTYLIAIGDRVRWVKKETLTFPPFSEYAIA